jgi:hypothetical protein
MKAFGFSLSAGLLDLDVHQLGAHVFLPGAVGFLHLLQLLL